MWLYDLRGQLKFKSTYAGFDQWHHTGDAVAVPVGLRTD
jgi:hypothetical protein